MEAHSDRSAGLVTFARSAVLADVSGDGDFRLVLADVKLQPDKRSRLKVYKGTLLTSDQVLPDIPSSLISFHTDNLDVRVPGLAPELVMFKLQFCLCSNRGRVWLRFAHLQEQQTFFQVLRAS